MNAADARAVASPVVPPWPRRFGERLTRSLRSPEIAQSKGAERIRRGLAAVFAAYGLLLSTSAVADGGIPAWPHLVMILLAAAVFSGRGGAFVRDWVPVILGFLAYTQATQVVERLHLGVHYLPQIEADRLLGFGTLPTQWLQERLYSGRTGALEVAALIAYASHFFVPLGVAFYMWWARGRASFNNLIFALLTVSVLAEVTYVLAPTAPPWLAAQDGHLPHVHQILKQALADVHLHGAAALKGDPDAYNIVAAVPSLHIAWPVIGLLAIRRYGLPRWVGVVQASQLVAVFLAIVYTGEHYVVDAFAGVLYACVAWRLVSSFRVPGAPRVPRRLRAAGAEHGQVLFEYAAIVSVVSIAAVAVLSVIGDFVNVSLTDVVNGF